MTSFNPRPRMGGDQGDEHDKDGNCFNPRPRMGGDPRY